MSAQAMPQRDVQDKEADAASSEDDDVETQDRDYYGTAHGGI